MTNEINILKPLRSISDTMKDVLNAKAEAMAIIKKAVDDKENKSCDIYVDINGCVFTYGDYPNPDVVKYTTRPANSTLVYMASVETSPIYRNTEAHYKEWIKTGEYTYEASFSYGSDFDNIRGDSDLKNALAKWIKKNRDKIHHVSLPMQRRIKLNKVLIDDRLKTLEQATTHEGPYSPYMLKDTLSAIDDIMAHMRSLQKEFKLQAEKDIPYFKAGKK